MNKQEILSKVSDQDLEGAVVCLCGCKYWENLTCISCAESLSSNFSELVSQILESMELVGIKVNA